MSRSPHGREISGKLGRAGAKQMQSGRYWESQTEGLNDKSWSFLRVSSSLEDERELKSTGQGGAAARWGEMLSNGLQLLHMNNRKLKWMATKCTNRI